LNSMGVAAPRRGVSKSLIEQRIPIAKNGIDAPGPCCLVPVVDLERVEVGAHAAGRRARGVEAEELEVPDPRREPRVVHLNHPVRVAAVSRVEDRPDVRPAERRHRTGWIGEYPEVPEAWAIGRDLDAGDSRELLLQAERFDRGRVVADDVVLGWHGEV